MAIDPGFRTGCKLVCLDPQGKLLHHATVFPHGSSGERDNAGAEVEFLCKEHTIEVIAVGNGTAGRETEAFIRGLDLPAGIPVEFRWTADARHYGGIAAGYRYGWDVKDLSDPDQWDVDFTPFPPHSATEPAAARVAKADIRTFFFGTHVFTIEVLDNSGYCSRVEVRINIIQFTMERNLLVNGAMVNRLWLKRKI